ncbi:MAG: hypothetical protein ACK5MF_15350 [Vibrio sp.]|uniref:hypothetical protein n=1 Tax=Vibrio sp. TaxID=678 RepID=UPI003A878B1E
MRIKNLNDVVSWEHIGEAQKGVHPIYWICWLVIFIPALIVVYIFHKKQYPLIELTYKDGSKTEVIVPPIEENSFMKKMDSVGATEIYQDEFNDDYKHCPYCDEEIKKKAIICKHCGQSIE